jgi:hypothetical protein
MVQVCAGPKHIKTTPERDLDYIKKRELPLQIASAGKALQDHAVISVPVEPSPMVGK